MPEKLVIERFPTSVLSFNRRNARTHSKKQVRQIAASIGEFGFVNPVLIDEANQVIAGHGRLAAARLLNLETIPAIRLSHLSETQKRALVIADNKLAENAEWDQGHCQTKILAIFHSLISCGKLQVFCAVHRQPGITIST